MKEILFIGAGLVLALLPAFLLMRNKRTASNLLAVSLFVAALNILHALIFSVQDTAGMLFEPLQFGLPPLFAGYIRSLFDQNWKPTSRHLVHFLPIF